MKPDGSGRKVVARDGGWPSFGQDSAGVYFHRLTRTAEASTLTAISASL